MCMPHFLKSIFIEFKYIYYFLEKRNIYYSKIKKEKQNKK